MPSESALCPACLRPLDSDGHRATASPRVFVCEYLIAPAWICAQLEGESTHIAVPPELESDAVPRYRSRMPEPVPDTFSCEVNCLRRDIGELIRFLKARSLSCPGTHTKEFVDTALEDFFSGREP